MAAPESPDDESLDEGEVLVVDMDEDRSDERIDKALGAALADLSRSRIQALIGAGRLTFEGEAVTDPSARARAGRYLLTVPAAIAPEPKPQDLPLTILFEDAHLVVVDKAAGMAVHPGPGVPDNTLVNALLHHCGTSLSGIGGVARPGIVHRLDKDTSGVMVVAKTDAAHQGLAVLFAEHDIERAYIALTRGAPDPVRGTIVTRIGRSSSDRKKMAVLKSGGREAITHYLVERVFGPPERPLAGRVICRLETGRTHQIRVHMASKGSPCLGDPVYGSGQPATPVREAIAAAGLKRQALHAAILGFVHPITGETLKFKTPPPDDVSVLEDMLSRL